MTEIDIDINCVLIKTLSPSSVKYYNINIRILQKENVSLIKLHNIDFSSKKDCNAILRSLKNNINKNRCNYNTPVRT